MSTWMTKRQQDMDLNKQEDFDILSYGARVSHVTFSSRLILTCLPNILNDMKILFKEHK